MKESPSYTYYALHAIQPRGKVACGIAALNQEGISGKKGRGIVNQVFSEEDLKKLEGIAAIGAVSSSDPDAQLDGAQPLIKSTKNGQVAIVYDGLIGNHGSLREELCEQGSVFMTESEAEVLLHRYARSNGDSIDARIARTFRHVEESYSTIFLTGNELIGIRGQHGVNPLEIGSFIRRGKEIFMLASETASIDTLAARHLGEIKPGELVVIDNNGLRRKKIFEEKDIAPCVLEHVYFGHPASRQFDHARGNSAIRTNIGAQLYLEHPVKADVIVPASDASIYYAIGFSRASKIPFGIGFPRSHYIGSQFVDPEASLGISRTSRKFIPDRETLEGNRVVICDEFILEGETFRELVQTSRQIGAREVHLRVAFPPYKYNCPFGKQSPKKTNLIANRMSVEEMRQYFGADSLVFLSERGLLQNPYLAGRNHCTYCFSGKHSFVKVNLGK